MRLISLCLFLLLTACSVGPEYKKPKIDNIPNHFKEGDILWSKAKPNADINRGEWWKIYNDQVLNSLEDKLNSNNQDIIAAKYTYEASLALVEQARSSYFPSIGATYDITKEREKINSSSSSTNTKISKSHALGLSASWELDLWGDVGYNVKYNIAGANASKADLASTRLSMQTSLAQYYFELRGADIEQKILDDIAESYREILVYTENQYKAGIADQTDINTARNNYYNAKVSSSSNKSTRAQYLHAIAVLIGENPSTFSLPINYKNKDQEILVPLSLPSQLLERRPDIAKAEQLVIQANAKIGNANAAFFPSITLGATTNYSGSGLGNLLSLPDLTWSLGPQLALGLFDGGYRLAQKKNAEANYKSTVSSYRNTVLNAFAEVEDQLASLKSSQEQTKLQIAIVRDKNDSLNKMYNQFKAGIIDYLNLLNNKIDLFNAQKQLSDNIMLKRLSEISLIKALGGGWKE